VRTAWDPLNVYLAFVIASTPAAAVRIMSGDAAASEFGITLAVVMVTAIAWELVFAGARRRPRDAGWIMTAWLLAILMPPGAGPALAVITASFAVVVGHHIFGGTGRYIASPALLGIAFVSIAYPETAQPWLDTVSPWLAPAVGLGAAYLVYLRLASWRTLAGGIAGAAGVGWLLAGFGTDEPVLAWHAHLAAGQFAFVLAFVATDPSINPLTRSSRWVYGIALGALTVAIREFDPSHPDGTVFAALLAALAIPFIDYVFLQRFEASKREAEK
jgi:Na+-transporting NADH:ubiquinone oxidoreductase subunit B